MQQKEYVVLLHGIFRSSYHMRKLASHLTECNYEVMNIDYPSTTASLEMLVENIEQQIIQHVKLDRKIHFVGYSMGGLLIRALLHKSPFTNLGRVVQLAPPNKGSEVADFLQHNLFYKFFYGPAGQQLITNQEHVKHILGGKIAYELGVIAGNFSFDLIGSYLIGKESDGTVSIESTKLEGMRDHIIVNASHAFFPSNKEVIYQTAYFLEHGKFDHH